MGCQAARVGPSPLQRNHIQWYMWSKIYVNSSSLLHSNALSRKCLSLRFEQERVVPEKWCSLLLPHSGTRHSSVSHRSRSSILGFPRQPVKETGVSKYSFSLYFSNSTECQFSLHHGATTPENFKTFHFCVFFACISLLHVVCAVVCCFAGCCQEVRNAPGTPSYLGFNLISEADSLPHSYFTVAL